MVSQKPLSYTLKLFILSQYLGASFFFHSLSGVKLEIQSQDCDKVATNRFMLIPQIYILKRDNCLIPPLGSKVEKYQLK